jgi:hypothetical protein
MRECYFKQDSETESIHMVIYVCSVPLYSDLEMILSRFEGVHDL